MIDLKKYSVTNGVDFKYINCNKFKTEKISVTFFLPLSEKTAAANSLLSNMLKRQCNKHPGFLELNKKLAELYGACLFSTVFKLGEAHGFTISITGIDDKYVLNKEEISKELSVLLCDVLFDPYLDESGLFSSSDLEEEKREIIDRIESETNDKRSFAKMRCEELMCKNEAFSVNRYGSKEQVEKLTAIDIYEAWQRNIKSAKIEIIQIGNSDFSFIYELFKKAFLNIDRTNIEACETYIKDADGVHEYSDVMDVNQCKLVMGFRVKFNENESMQNRLMTSIFGETPSSKLFLNVREKMSLCYYCSARYYKNKSILIVQSGVEQGNIEKARDEILNQLKQMKSGNINEDEINSAKKSLINSFKTGEDALSFIENFYLSQAFDDKIISTDTASKIINTTTKEQIVKAANNVTLDTIYVLRGDKT